MYAEKAGVNQIIIDSADDFAGAARNIAFSLALYTGQMCTAPQNIYVPRDGIETGDGHLSFDHVAQGLGAAVQKLVGDPARAVEILGAVVNDGVAERIHAARSLGAVVHDSQALVHPPVSRGSASRRRCWSSSTPRDGANVSEGMVRPDRVRHRHRRHGAKSRYRARRAVVDHGALTLSLYSKRPDVIEDTIALAEDAGVALSINLTGGVFVNQSAAFSDYHRHRRQSGRQRRADRFGVRRRPIPGRAAPEARLRRRRNELRQHTASRSPAASRA